MKTTQQSTYSCCHFVSTSSNLYSE